MNIVVRNIIFSLFLLCIPLTVLCQSGEIISVSRPTVECFPEGGFYTSSVRIELFCPGGRIYFTTDGSRPYPAASQRYKEPIQITETTVIRATALVDGKVIHPVSHTYFINEPPTELPIVSLAISPGTLFDWENGLFMKGSNTVDSLWKKPGANFWSRQETSLNVEIFEPSGECVFRHQTGMRLFGGMSRLFPQKSMAIVARKRYGKKRIKHKIFGKEGLKKFKYLVLRNSGSDFGKTHFRDALMTSLTDDWNVDKQDYRAAHTYINGKYWGIYNIREKINRYFIASHHEVHKDSIDLLEHRGQRKRGSSKEYRELLHFLERSDLSLDANYRWISGQIDIDNFIDYQIAQIYFDNRDAGGNIKYWRPQQPDGKWRWILYDTDWGMGLHHTNAWEHNSLIFHTEPNGPSWPNPPWSTFILRKLLENESFRHRFLNRFADRINTTLTPENINRHIDLFYNQLSPEIDRHLNRWNRRRTVWEEQVELLRTFAKERPGYMWRYLSEYFDIPYHQFIRVEATSGGHVILNENLRIDSVYEGKYFQTVAIQLEAVAHLGYRFVGWKSSFFASDKVAINLRPNYKLSDLEAVFEPYRHPLEEKIIFNEISCNNKITGDWIELYNTTEKSIQLKNWMITDKKNEFYFPSVVIPAKDYLIVCEDSAAFKKAHRLAYNYIGGLGFGLHKREEILQLYAADGAGVDSIAYRIEPRDSVFALNLLLPWLDNSDPENWEIREGFGTPNTANAYYVQSTLKERRNRWMQMGMSAGVAIICMLLLVLRRKRMI